MTLEPGSMIGPYRVLEQAGRGGMATVYKAYQAALARNVAIKVLPAFFADDPGFRERFRQEAVAVAKLRHPNILQVFDYGDENGLTYIVSEFIDGGTLADQIGRPLPVDYVTRMLGPVASALDYAHSREVLHRDVKPSNVLLARDGTPILSDFGLAKMMGSMPRLTVSGAAVGTPEYMAPEQGSGEEIGPAADQYALGVVAYEMLTGRVPFSAETPLAVLIAHMHQALPLPRTVNPALSEATEQVLLKALAKAPADRFPSATEFVRALGDAVRGASATPVVPAAAPVYPTPAVAAAAAAAPSPAPAAVAGPATRIPRNARIGAALLALLLVGGAAFAFTRGGGGTSTASTKGTIALRGPLIYEAKLDAAGSEIQRQPGPPGRTADPNAIRTLDGAVQFTLPENQSLGASGGPTALVINWRRSFPATFFAEMDLKVAPGSQVNLVWRLRQLPQGSVQLVATTGFDESMQLQYQSQPGFGAPQGQNCPPNCPAPGVQGCPPNCPSLPGASPGQFCPPTCPGPPAPGSQGGTPSGQPGAGQFVQPETIGTPVGVSGFASGDKVTIGIAVQPQGVFTMFFNGQNVGQVTEARAAAAGAPAGGGPAGGGPAGGGLGVLSIDVHGQSGTLTLAGFRVYQLAAP